MNIELNKGLRLLSDEKVLHRMDHRGFVPEADLGGPPNWRRLITGQTVNRMVLMGKARVLGDQLLYIARSPQERIDRALIQIMVAQAKGVGLDPETLRRTLEGEL